MKRLLLQWILPTAIAVGLLWLAFRQIEDPAAIPGHIASVPWHIHVLFIVISLVSMYLRAIRWRALLPDHPVTSNQCFGPLMIGFMMNSLFPARAGEFARAIVLARKTHRPFSTLFGSVVLERVFDGVVLLASFALVLGVIGADLPERVVFGSHEITRDNMRAAVTTSSIGVVVILAGIIAMLFPAPRRLAEGAARLVLPKRFAERAINQLEKLIGGFHSLHSPRAIANVLFWTVAVWATVALSVLVAAWGFPELADMSFLQAWAIVVFVCIAIMLPASPGYWGLYEAGVIVACIALGLTTDNGIALSYSFVMHVWQIVPNIIVGVAYLWAEGLHMGQLSRARAAETLAEDPPPAS